MAIALILPKRDMNALREAIVALDAGLEVRLWPDLDAAEIELAVAWEPPEDAFSQLPPGTPILSFGAGVDHLSAGSGWPPEAVVGRIVYPGLRAQMGEYALAAVLHHRRGFHAYEADQRKRRWAPREVARVNSVGILGLGETGRTAAQYFAEMGFRVIGWSRRQKLMPDVLSLTGDNGLGQLVQEADYLVCMLPLTDALRGVLNRELFDRCKPGAYLINVARGAHLVEEDLIHALDAGRLSGACLDVFNDEPLPEDHPFWIHPKIRITPHVAGITDTGAAAERIVADYRRIRAGQGLSHPVDLQRGY